MSDNLLYIPKGIYKREICRNQKLILQYVERNRDRNISIQELASELFLQTQHVRMYCKDLAKKRYLYLIKMDNRLIVFK